MPQNPEGFACAIHELRLNIEAALKNNQYYRASQKLWELRQIAGEAVGALKSAAPVESRQLQTAPEPLVFESLQAVEPEAPPPGFGDALAALRASVKMEVWDDRYYEVVRIINAISEAAATAGVRTPQARLPHPRYTVAESLRRVRRAASAELRDNAFYGVARFIQQLAELLPQEPIPAPEPAPAPARMTSSPVQDYDPNKPRSFDDLAAASARRVARLAHPASFLGKNGSLGKTGGLPERRSPAPNSMEERLR